jgi:hypothetical protein
MSRDAATPVLLAVLLLLAAAGSGAFGLAVALAAWLAVVTPSLSRARPLDAAVFAAVASPVLVAVARAEGPGALAPVTPLVAGALAAGLLGAAAGGAVRRAVAALGVAVLLLPLLRGAGLPLPRVVEDAEVEVAFGDVVFVPPAVAGVSERDGGHLRRPGALAPTRGRAGPFDEGAGWRPVPPGSGWDVAAGAPAAFVVARGAGVPLDAAGVVSTAGPVPARVIDLDPYDVLWVREATTADEAGTPAAAHVLASFARRGGLLVGPASPAEWPAALARRLGRAARGEVAGVEGARPFGAGRVARAGSERDVAALLHAGRHRPRVSTAFDRAISPPPSTAGIGAGAPAGGRAPLALLGAFAAAVVAAGGLRGARRAVLRGSLSAVALLGVLAAVPPTAAVSAAPFRIDVAGTGGRRVEGLCLTAGPRGWVQDARVPAVEGGLRFLGFRVVAREGSLRLSLRPGARGWIVEESTGEDPPPGLERAAALPDWAAPLVTLRDPAAQSGARVLAGRAPYAGPRVPGVPVAPECPAVSVLP